MNLFNLIRRPSLVKVPETSQEMVNQMLINAIEELGIKEDNMHYLEERCKKMEAVLNRIGNSAEVSKYASGIKSIFINDFIYESNPIFDDAIHLLSLEEKYMAIDAEQEETES